MNRFEWWKLSEYAALWNEAASMKQAKNYEQQNNGIPCLPSENTLSPRKFRSCRTDFIIRGNSIRQQKNPHWTQKNCIQEETKFSIQWKAIDSKLFNLMAASFFWIFSCSQISQQLGHQQCTHSSFSTQSIDQFPINNNEQGIPSLN